MTEYKDVDVSRILNPTAIDLGEYVINPYRGCEFSCLYCYVRSNKTALGDGRPWGSYVDSRINCVQQLEKELRVKKPKSVLLGSTTECFQPIEKEKGLSKKILEVLNENGIYYSILTRSPLIAEYADLLSKGYCKKIYFTVNSMDDKLKSVLEPKSPGFEIRFKAIEELAGHHIPVIPYFSPVLPWISDFGPVFERFKSINMIELEGLNFNLANINDIFKAIFSAFPDLEGSYQRLLEDRVFYEDTWNDVRKNAVSCAIRNKKSYNIYIHKFGSYFENKYEGKNE
ncbi:MAG TPA: radical SAM protein [Candidatus Omnitrophota bacterium]|nr:radical SAM protein [Candidatus Omnitrophota bacterium]